MLQIKPISLHFPRQRQQSPGRVYENIVHVTCTLIGVHWIRRDNRNGAEYCSWKQRNINIYNAVTISGHKCVAVAITTVFLEQVFIRIHPSPESVEVKWRCLAAILFRKFARWNVSV